MQTRSGTAVCGEVELYYEDLGDIAAAPVLLIMGVGAQLPMWPDGFCEQLVRRGHRVIRYDHRDIGLSTKMAGHRAEGSVYRRVARYAVGRTSPVPYTLVDMADDAVSLLDYLQIDDAHVVGASMGGMIAQEVALRHPERLLTLTSIMSTTAPNVGPPTPAASAVLFSPPATTESEAAERAITVYRVIGSPGHRLDEVALSARAQESFRRANDPAGVARQLAAIHASGDRTARLRDLAVPTLVLHGEDDPLVQVEGGRATAAAVPGARLVTWPGMGHDLPRGMWPDIIGEITAHAGLT